MKTKLQKTLLFLTVLAGINLLSNFLFFRIDLTQEKRYTISDATKKMLRNLDGQVLVSVYLSGNFPAGFERLESAVRETLTAFQNEAGTNLAFKFIEPTDPQLQEELSKKGLIPTNLFAKEEGKQTEQIVFPGAIVKYEGKEYAVQLLKGNKASSAEEQLNQSYEGVEFELAATIRQVTQKSRKKIGFLVRHTKVPPARFSDLIANLQQRYDIFFDLNKPTSYDGLDLVIVPKPDSPFSDEEVFAIDQFIVKGGKALFFIDGVQVDSVSQEGTFAQPIKTGLENLLFKYGVRVNANLVKDLSCASIPLNVGNMGDKPEIKAVPWRFFPLVNNFGIHPITRNLDAIYTRFTSSIDTVFVANIHKTPLLLSSQYTKLLNVPVLVAYNEARQQPNPADYNAGIKNIAVLLEGAFSSSFSNQILPSDPRATDFVSAGKPSKIIVCSDGDIIVNDIDYRRNAPLPLGYDRLSRNTFANKDFALYAIDYLLDSEGLITARNKQVTLRPLDKIKLKDQRLQWQLLNLLGPLLLIVILGLLWQWARKRNYSL